MSFGYGAWAPYVPVAERRRKAAREIARLKKAGRPVAPVVVEGRKIATTFWGKAWCDNLEAYGDYANRLPRGQTYVRNGSVIDLWIGPREVTAKVSGSEIYSVRITFEALPIAAWKSICADCAGRVASLVELLQGRLSKAVMDRVCRQGDGLFPKPAGIRLSCSCPDSASLCKHVAAALYGTGARLDAEPELLFRMREVDPGEIFANLDAALPAARGGGAEKRLDSGDLTDIFGIEMAAPASAPRGKASTLAKPSPAAKISRPETGDAKKTMRAGPAKPARARQSPAIPNEPVQEPGRRSGRKPSLPAPSPAMAESAAPARKRRVMRKTIFKKGVRKTRKQAASRR
ncbi:MAG: SWIM zinc finger family protein [Methylocella sp.]